MTRSPLSPPVGGDEGKGGSEPGMGAWLVSTIGPMRTATSFCSGSKRIAYCRHRLAPRRMVWSMMFWGFSVS